MNEWTNEWMNEWQVIAAPYLPKKGFDSEVFSAALDI